MTGRHARRRLGRRGAADTPSEAAWTSGFHTHPDPSARHRAGHQAQPLADNEGSTDPVAAYYDADDPSDLPGRPARNYFDIARSMSSDPQVLAALDRAEARAGLTEQARRNGVAYPQPGRWARLRALLTERFTPVKED